MSIEVMLVPGDVVKYTYSSERCALWEKCSINPNMPSIYMYEFPTMYLERHEHAIVIAVIPRLTAHSHDAVMVMSFSGSLGWNVSGNLQKVWLF